MFLNLTAGQLIGNFVEDIFRFLKASLEADDLRSYVFSHYRALLSTKALKVFWSLLAIRQLCFFMWGHEQEMPISDEMEME